MKRRGLMYLFSLCVLLSISAAANAQEVMTNSEVISLTRAGLAPSVIIGKIRSSKAGYDLSTDSLITLKKAGVSDDVVTAMLEARSGRSAASSAAGDSDDPMAKHSYGIYYVDDTNGGHRMIKLQPTVSAQNRTGGQFTAAVTPFGLGKIKTKANLPGRTAGMQLATTKPVFYFYLDTTSGGLNTASGIPSTPNEFTLIRFNQRADNREVTIAKANSWGAKGGLSDEYVVGLKAEDLGNGIFKVTPAGPLPKGEYGFYLVNSGNSNASAAIGAKFFDFGVNPIP